MKKSLLLLFCMSACMPVTGFSATANVWRYRTVYSSHHADSYVKLSTAEAVQQLRQDPNLPQRIFEPIEIKLSLPAETQPNTSPGLSHRAKLTNGLRQRRRQARKRFDFADLLAAQSSRFSLDKPSQPLSTLLNFGPSRARGKPAATQPDSAATAATLMQRPFAALDQLQPEIARTAAQLVQGFDNLDAMLPSMRNID